MRNLADTLGSLGPGRIGELNLLLRILTEVTQDRDFVAKAVLGFSGGTDQIPQPDLYIPLALSLGLVAETDDRLLTITELGLRMKEANDTTNIAQLTLKQLDLLLPELLGHPHLRPAINGALGLLKRNLAGIYCVEGIPDDPTDALGLQILQACCVTCYDGVVLTAQPAKIDFVKELLGTEEAVSDEELWLILDATNKRARAAEEFVVSFERARLSEEGLPELARQVRRRSATNGRSPYDVESFNSDASPRFIEVKSSVATRLSFYWTESERRFASHRRLGYWLYYVPRSQDLPNLKFDMTLIRDPIGLIGSHLIEEAVTYRVSLRSPLLIERHLLAGIRVALTRQPKSTT